MKNEKLLLSLLAVLLSTSAASAEMVRVEGGTFVMADCHDRKQRVTVSDFEICSVEKGAFCNWWEAVVECNRMSRIAGYTPCYSINGITDEREWGAMSGARHGGRSHRASPVQVGGTCGKEERYNQERQFQKSRWTFETGRNSPQESQVVRSTAEILVSQCKSNRLLQLAREHNRLYHGVVSMGKIGV